MEECYKTTSESREERKLCKYKMELEGVKPYRPLKPFGVFEKLHAQSYALLNNVDIRTAVKCPANSSSQQWIAMHIVDFYNQTSGILGFLDGICSEETCPIMNAGPKYQYLWADGEDVKKPMKCSAPQYLSFLTGWVKKQIENPDIVPVDSTFRFGLDFYENAKAIFKRMFRIYGHVYYSHFKAVETVKYHEQLNASFRHFTYFVEEFQLVEAKEMKPLAVLIEGFHKNEDQDMVPLKSKPADLIATKSLSSENSLVNFDTPKSDFLDEEPNLLESSPEQNATISAVPLPAVITLEDLQRDINEAFPLSPPPPLPSHRGFSFDINQISGMNPRIDSYRDEEDLSPRNNEDREEPTPLTEEELEESRDSLGPLPSDTRSFTPSEYGNLGSFTFTDEDTKHDTNVQVADMYFDSFIDSHFDIALEEEPSSLAVELSRRTSLKDEAKAFCPTVAFIGLSSDIAAKVEAYQKAGYDVSAIWADSQEDFDGASGWLPNVTTHLDEVMESSPNLIILNGESLGKRKDNLLLSLIDDCISDFRTFGLSSSALSLPKRRQVFDRLRQHEKNGPVSFSSHPLRFHPMILELKARMSAQELGALVSMNLSYHGSLSASMSSYTSNSLPESRLKSMLADTSASLIDVFSWLVGDSDSGIVDIVSSFSSTPGSSTSSPNYHTIQAKTSSNINGGFSVSFVESDAVPSFSIEIIGHEGSIVATDSVLVYKSQHGNEIIDLGTEVADKSNDPLVVAQQLMNDALKTHLYADLHPEFALLPEEMKLIETFYNVLPTIHEGYRNMRIVEAIRRQQLIETRPMSKVTEILKISPKAIRQLNSQTKSQDSRVEAVVSGVAETQFVDFDAVPSPPPRIKGGRFPPEPIEK